MIEFIENSWQVSLFYLNDFNGIPKTSQQQSQENLSILQA